MIFIGDENVPRRGCLMLNAFDADHAIEHLTDRFEPGIADTEWLRLLGEQDEPFAVLTRDAAILRRKDEFAALRDSGGHLVVLSPRFRTLKRDALLLAMLNNWRVLTAAVVPLRHPSLIRWDHKGGKRAEIERRLSGRG